MAYPQANKEVDKQAVASEDGNYVYRIKPGDTIEISVYGEPNLTKTVKVSEEGKIIYPFIGEIIIGNLTTKEATAKIENLLKKDYFVNPQVNIFIKEYAKFFIIGAINSEGSYELIGNLSLLEALALADGAKQNANLTNIKIIRKVGNEEKEYIVDFNKHGRDFLLQPLDRIIVKGYGDIAVLGQVRKPGSYKYSKGLTAIEAIALAGGFTDIADQNAVKVIRRAPGQDKKETFNVPIAHILKSGDKSRDVELKENDIISVPESFF